MALTLLVTGGTRSGKSNFAEERVRDFGQHLGKRLVYIATAEAFDEEMAARIARHQRRRGPEWHTVHAPLDLVRAVKQTDGKGPCVIDCLTLWLSNLMLDGADWRDAGERLVRALDAQTTPVVLVTNEVGGGIVPENKLAREFRDAAGSLNQTVAEACDSVWLSVAGCPVKVKPNDHSF